MDTDLELAINIVENNVYTQFEEIWKSVVDTKVPEHRVMIWGSIVDDRDRDPVDMDILIEYMGEKVSSEKENSIESQLKSEIYYRI